MEKKLKRTRGSVWHYADGERVDGLVPDLWGDCSNLRGNCSNLRGDCSNLQGNCSNLRGDCSDLWGNCSDLWGDCSNLRGNLDSCEISDAERARGINIAKLVSE